MDTYNGNFGRRTEELLPAGHATLAPNAELRHAYEALWQQAKAADPNISKGRFWRKVLTAALPILQGEHRPPQS